MEEFRETYPLMLGRLGNLGSHRATYVTRKPSTETVDMVRHHRIILDKLAREAAVEKNLSCITPLPEDLEACAEGVCYSALKKNSRCKVDQYLAFLKRCSEFKPDWHWLQHYGWDHSPMRPFSKGILYRTPRGSSEPSNQSEFDRVCDKWFLSGYRTFEKEPIVEEPTFILDATGTSLRIPGYFSVDLARDLAYAKLKRLHSMHGARRQGAKLLANQEGTKRQALLALEAHQEAKSKGLRGEKRLEFMKAKIGLCDETDAARVRFLVRMGRALVAAAEKSKPPPADAQRPLPRAVQAYRSDSTLLNNPRP